jgi:hypothetical protein
MLLSCSGLARSRLRASKWLHMDYQKTLGVEPDARSEDDRTEEDDAEFKEIVKEVDELEVEENPEEGSGEVEGEQG